MYRMLSNIKVFIEFYFRMKPFSETINSSFRSQTSNLTFNIQKEFLQALILFNRYIEIL